MSLRSLAKHCGIDQKTVAEWKRQRSVINVPTGPKKPRSTVPSIEDEAIVVAFRRHTLRQIDNCFYALQATIPHLTRLSPHRYLQRHGIFRLPDVNGDKPQRRKFNSYPLGYFHFDIAEVRTEHIRASVGWCFTLTATAYNLIRLRKLLGAANT